MPHTKQTVRTDCKFRPQPESSKALQKLKAAIQAERETISMQPLRGYKNQPFATTSYLALHRANHALLNASLAIDSATRSRMRAESLRQEIARQWHKLNSLNLSSPQAGRQTALKP